ncbi:hypothetical protein TNCV_203231 [Trichonephila clavipes]|nr:hypothetical protein TNCV_203231 [Trichonephila clavipes]
MGLWTWLPSGKGIGSWLVCHDLEPSTTKDPSCSYTRDFGGGPSKFHPQSSDEDDTCAGTPSPNFHTIPSAGRLSLDRFKAQHLYMEGCQWY